MLSAGSEVLQHDERLQRDAGGSEAGVCPAPRGQEAAPAQQQHDDRPGKWLCNFALRSSKKIF